MRRAERAGEHLDALTVGSIWRAAFDRISTISRKFILVALIALAPSHGRAQTRRNGDPARGARVFQACASCHSLTPNHNMTGPSLAGVFGRKAGSLASFHRYSKAIKASNVIWNSSSLEAWIADPQKFIPGTAMTFAGLAKNKDRLDLIAFLKGASAHPPALKGPGVGAPGDHDLKKLAPSHKVVSIAYCPDNYRVRTADGKVHVFWERNLRFETDSSAIGPKKGAAALFGAGMQGDRAAVIFGDPAEISGFIKRRCSHG